MRAAPTAALLINYTFEQYLSSRLVTDMLPLGLAET
jgi:hypothetical protein